MNLLVCRNFLDLTPLNFSQVDFFFMWLYGQIQAIAPCRKKHNTQKRQTSLRPVIFEPTNRSRELPQTHAFDRAAPEVGYMVFG
jgi:hypothetical protein